jgi:hypothetical protein
MQDKIDKELQYWKIKKNEKNDKTQSAPTLLETAKSTNLKDPLEKLLVTIPTINPNVSNKSLEQWKKMKPLTIEEIQKNSDYQTNLEDGNIEFKEVKAENHVSTGMFKRGTSTVEGIARRVFAHTQI